METFARALAGFNIGVTIVEPGGLWGIDGPASARTSRDLLGWELSRHGLITGLEEDHCFA